jgi:hypothetical protein
VVFWPPHSSRPTQARHSSDRGYRTNRVPASVILPTDYTTGTSGTIDTPDALNTTIAAGVSALEVSGKQRSIVICAPKPRYVYAEYYGRAAEPQ